MGYYYDGFISIWYPGGDYEFYYSYLKMPERLFEADRGEWVKFMDDPITVLDVPSLPYVFWPGRWAFDLESGDMSVSGVPSLPEWPDRDRVWLKLPEHKAELNNVPDFASMPYNAGYGYAGELVIVDDSGEMFEFEAWYESMYTEEELMRDVLVLRVDGKNAVCILENGDVNKRVYIDTGDLHI